MPGQSRAMAKASETAPPCPICAAPSIPYGRQDYTVPGGALPSWIYRCKACDFNFRRFDRPHAEVAEHFLVAPYSSHALERRWLHSRVGFYRYLLDMLPKPAKGTALLDIGCAFGHFLNCAAQRGYEPFGTEVSEAMAKLTRSRCPYPVSVRPIHDLRLSRDRFDAITFVDSFYYFDDPLTTLGHARQLLKPRGQLLMRVTNRNARARVFHLRHALTWPQRGARVMPFRTTDDAISCHSRRSLRVLMARAGFRIITLTGVERGKRIDAAVPRNIYRLTNCVCRLTRERLCYTSGLVCLATPA